MDQITVFKASWLEFNFQKLFGKINGFDARPKFGITLFRVRRLHKRRMVYPKRNCYFGVHLEMERETKRNHKVTIFQTVPFARKRTHAISNMRLYAQVAPSCHLTWNFCFSWKWNTRKGQMPCCCCSNNNIVSSIPRFLVAVIVVWSINQYSSGHTFNKFQCKWLLSRDEHLPAIVVETIDRWWFSKMFQEGLWQRKRLNMLIQGGWLTIFKSKVFLICAVAAVAPRHF